MSLWLGGLEDHPLCNFDISYLSIAISLFLTPFGCLATPALAKIFQGSSHAKIKSYTRTFERLLLRYSGLRSLVVWNEIFALSLRQDLQRERF